MLSNVAPIGSGFRFDGFHRQNVVGLIPAHLQTAFIVTPARRALASISATIDSWFMDVGIICNNAHIKGNNAQPCTSAILLTAIHGRD